MRQVRNVGAGAMRSSSSTASGDISSAGPLASAADAVGASPGASAAVDALCAILKFTAVNRGQVAHDLLCRPCGICS